MAQAARSPVKEADLAEILADPVVFAEFLGAGLWDGQVAILDALANHERVAVKAAHSVGKTRTAACAALWWAHSRPDATVLVIAPTWAQAKNVDIPEIRRLLRDSKVLDMFAEALPVEEFETVLKFGGEATIRAMSTDDPSRIQGYHGSVLLILDEVAGIRPELFDAFEGIRAGGAGTVRILALGNPTTASGVFNDMFAPRSGWEQLTISAFDTPNLEGVSLERLLEMDDDELADNPRPYLTTRSFVREKYREWGPDSPAWASRIIGEFPEQSSAALYSAGWLESARAPVESTDAAVVAGLDVAGPGEDETVLAVRRGQNLETLEIFREADPRGRVLAALERYRHELETVRVDVVGIGYNFALHLQDHDIPVVMANVGEGPTRLDRHKYKNLRAEAYWSVREQLAEGLIGGLEDGELRDQMRGISYEYDSAGRLVIESKEKTRKRGVPSPDRADAIVLAFAAVPRWENASGGKGMHLKF